MYAANTGFAIALNVSAGLWIPVLMAVALGLVPASLALLLKPARAVQQAAAINEPRDSIARRLSLLTVYVGSRMLTPRKAQVMVEGLEYVPRTGPVLIVARHFHHLYDGCVLLRAVPRRLHILVALDWIQKLWLRRILEWACAMVDWPAMLRIERLGEVEDTRDRVPMVGSSAYTRDEVRPYLRRAAADSVRLLCHGEVLVVFPEAYPNIDPAPTPKKEQDAFLPFRPGFARLVEMAERNGSTRVAIVPAGFTYVQRERWHITLRFGPALFREDYPDATYLVQAAEQRVHELSHHIAGSALSPTEETVQL
jgi:putative membrane protein